jgi:hypothetical protein
MNFVFGFSPQHFDPDAQQEREGFASVFGALLHPRTIQSRHSMQKRTEIWTNAIIIILSSSPSQ